MKPLAVLLSLAVSWAAGAQETPPKKPCSAPQYRQFDFWIGEWDVKLANGKVAGTNSITSTHGGCVIEERWKGTGGVVGASLNIYDESDGKWHQTWVDNSGSRLALSGTFDGGKMVLTDKTNRITWTPLADGTVRQLWESTTDGKTWTIAFDGIYKGIKK
ncbi:MAG: hypothetical protein JJE51_02670 [Thermoanaerobaculia bacterium]|nr:hypothetical protein [Thermoanaerobaculia bacterium]